MGHTHHAPNRILIVRIPPDTHHHPPHPSPSPPSSSSPSSSSFSTLCVPLPLPQPHIINIHPRPPVINPALHILVAPDAQARKRYVRRRYPQLRAPASEPFHYGAREADREGRGGAGWGTGDGGAGGGGAHWVLVRGGVGVAEGGLGVFEGAERLLVDCRC